MKKLFGVILIVFVFLFLGGSLLSALGTLVKEDEPPVEAPVINSPREISFSITGAAYTTTANKKWSELAKEIDGVTVHESGKIMKGSSYLVTSAGYAVLFTDTVTEGEKYTICGHTYVNEASCTSMSNIEHRFTSACIVCGYEKHMVEIHNYLNYVCTECDHRCTHMCDTCGVRAEMCDHNVQSGTCWMCGAEAEG